METRKLFAATLLITVLSIPAIANAALVTWEIKSSITEVWSDMAGYASIGDVITLRYTFDLDALDTQPSTLYRGKYDNAVVSSDIYLNGNHAHIDNTGYITILNNAPSGEDIFLASAYRDLLDTQTLPDYNFFRFQGYSFGFTDIQGSMLSDTTLITEPVFLGHERFRLTLNFGKPIGGGSNLGSIIRAENLISIENISTVPVPSAVWLFSSGLIGLIGLAKRKAS